MTIMKGLNEGIACCVPRRRDTLQLQLNTNLGLAWLHCLAMASLGQRNSVVTIGAGRWGLGAGSKDDRDKQTDNRVHTTAGDREDVASCSRFPHSALDSGHSGLQDNCELRAG